MKKVLRGALVAAGTFAAVAGFGASASAAPIPETPGVPDINILNDACILPWYWQGPINFLVGMQDGSYAVCNGAEAPSEGINIGNNACILPWFWQGPFNIGLGSQDGSYAACNGSAAEPVNMEDVESIEVLEDSELPEDVKNQILEQLS